MPHLSLLADAALPGLDLSQLGVAGIIVLILLYGIGRLWKDNLDLRHELSAVQTSSLEKVTTVATTATAQMTEGAKALEAATVMMHQLSGRPGVTAEQLYEIGALLRELRSLRS